MKIIEEDEDGNVVDEATVEGFKTDEDIKLSIFVGKSVTGSTVKLAFYYNPETEEWEFVRSEIDDENGEMLIFTNHLSIYSVMNVSEGGLVEYLISEIVNKTNPGPSLNEILNIIETPEMKLNLSNYNKLSLSNQANVANGIIDVRPEDGYTYETFVSTFTAEVKRYTKDDKKDSVTEIVVEESSIEIINQSNGVTSEVIKDLKDSDAPTMNKISDSYQLVATEFEESTVIIKYDPELVTNPEQLLVFYFDEDIESWISLGGIVDAKNNEILVTIDEPLILAVFENSITFTDIDEHWAKNVIEILAARNILEGNDGEFNPYMGTTRAEMAALLVRLGDYDLQESESGFTDVDSDKWYNSAIATARKEGIIKGVSETEFEPDRIVSRQEMVTMFMRLFEKTESEISIEADLQSLFIDDSMIDNYARDFVYKAKTLGIIEGRTDNSMAPFEVSTRGETAMVIYRYLKKLGKL